MNRPVRAAGHARTGPTSLLAVLVAALLGCVGSLAWLVLLPAPAGAAAKPCVGVIVDARLLGGDVRTGCAVGDPDSGLEALTKAGFGYAFVPRQPGLVCQIDRAPECTDTSTTTYWSYWYRAKGSKTWVYSSAGAASHDPAPGSTEAWVWQEGGRKQPPDIALTTICPQAAAEPTATKTAKKTPSPDVQRTVVDPVRDDEPVPARDDEEGRDQGGREEDRDADGGGVQPAGDD